MANQAELPVQEETILYRGYKTWFLITGEKEVAGKLPLICLHGGPGATHDDFAGGHIDPQPEWVKEAF